MHECDALAEDIVIYLYFPNVLTLVVLSRSDPSPFIIEWKRHLSRCIQDVACTDTFVNSVSCRQYWL